MAGRVDRLFIYKKVLIIIEEYEGIYLQYKEYILPLLE